MLRAFSVICLVCVLPNPLFARSVADDDSDLKFGREVTRMFFVGDLAPIWEGMTHQLRRELGSAEFLSVFRAQVQAQVGSEQRIVREWIEETPGYVKYTRHSLYASSALPIITTWTLDDEGALAGFSIRPQQNAAESEYLAYETKATLHLPFSGEWKVVLGGREVDDNNPGHTDGRNLPGNHIVLDLGNAEFAVMAHFKQHSVAVQSGSTIESGDVIGLCGNSGNSTEPHLHFHVQDSPEFGAGNGKPAQFVDYLSNELPVARGEPRRGESIQRQSPDGE